MCGSVEKLDNDSLPLPQVSVTAVVLQGQQRRQVGRSDVKPLWLGSLEAPPKVEKGR